MRVLLKSISRSCWDSNLCGLSPHGRYQWSENINVKAGAMLGFGLASTGVTSDVDPAWALLAEQLDSNEPLVKMVGQPLRVLL